jgi:hypothetical protein
MKKTTLTILLILLMLGMTSCSGWVFRPSNLPTPFLPPTGTPSIFTATPIVLVPSATSTIEAPAPTATSIVFITPTDTQTPLPSGPMMSVEVLGCDTSIDILHGMGEVTNTYIVLRNTGGINLTNLQATLRALDEGREHPDKTVEVPLVPIGHRVTLKLTVDSTYRAETPIQVEVRGDSGLFVRVGADSCRDIGLFAPNPESLYTPVPDNP